MASSLQVGGQLRAFSIRGHACKIRQQKVTRRHVSVLTAVLTTPATRRRAVLGCAGIKVSNTSTRSLNTWRRDGDEPLASWGRVVDTHVDIEVNVRDTPRVDGLDDHGLARRSPRRPCELVALAARRRRGVTVTCEAVREGAVDDDRLVLVAGEGEVARGGEARVLRTGVRGTVVLVAGLHGTLRAWGEVGGVATRWLTAMGDAGERQYIEPENVVRTSPMSWLLCPTSARKQKSQQRALR